MALERDFGHVIDRTVFAMPVRPGLRHVWVECSLDTQGTDTDRYVDGTVMMAITYLLGLLTLSAWNEF